MRVVTALVKGVRPESISKCEAYVHTKSWRAVGFKQKSRRVHGNLQGDYCRRPKLHKRFASSVTLDYFWR